MARHCVGEFNGGVLARPYSPKEACEQAYGIPADPGLLAELRKPQYRKDLVANNIAIAKKAIAASVSREIFIIQAINALEELDRICNSLSKRAREWYGYYFPESTRIEDNEIFIRNIVQKDKPQLMKEFDLEESMGPDIESEDLKEIIGFARQAESLFSERDALKSYIEKTMQQVFPNTTAVAGSLIGAKLLERAGSLRHLSMMPSSTIQLLGAEKALFRHLRNKSIRPPKHGIILNHPSVLDAKNKGKAARQLASKISIASKVDYFKGEFIGDKL